MTDEQQQVLMSLGNYYESGIDSFGHGRDDHVATVVLRACTMAQMLQESGTLPNNEQIDMDMVKATSAFHDIGNSISRDGHNHYGYGIIMGQLPPEKILDVAIKDPQTKEYASQSDMDSIRKEIEEKGKLDFGKENSLLIIGGDKVKLGTRDCTKLAVAKIELTFEIGYNGITPSALRPLIAQKYNVPENSPIAQYFYNQLVNENGQYKDNALQMSDNDKQNILNNMSYYEKTNISDNGLYEIYLKQKSEELHKLTDSVQAAYTPDELKIIAESIQDHNVDYKIPQTRCDKKTMAKDSINRYEARSVYGMITADADKTADPVSETIRMMKYSTEKLVAEGNTDVCLCYKDEKGALTPIRDNNGNFIPDMERIKRNCALQMAQRYGLDGSDIYFQLDKKYELDIGNKIYGDIQAVAVDCSLSNEKGPEFNKCYVSSNQLLIENGDNSGRAIMAREAERFGIDASDGSIWDDAINFKPDTQHYLETSYEMPEIKVNKKNKQLATLDEELSANGSLATEMTNMQARMSSRNVSTDEKLEKILPKIDDIRKTITEKNAERNAMRVGENPKAKAIDANIAPKNKPSKIDKKQSVATIASKMLKSAKGPKENAINEKAAKVADNIINKAGGMPVQSSKSDKEIEKNDPII